MIPKPDGVSAFSRGSGYLLDCGYHVCPNYVGPVSRSGPATALPLGGPDTYPTGGLALACLIALKLSQQGK